MSLFRLLNQQDKPDCLDISPGIKTFFNITGFVLILNFILYCRATFLPFARFVGGVEMILKKLLPFIIVSLLLLLAFAYSFWIINHDKCTTLEECFSWTIGSIFNFELEDGDYVALLFLFMFIILMVLLNVVIAIVSDAWTISADQSTQFFWKFRLEKMFTLGYLDTYNGQSFAGLHIIDSIRYIPVGSSDVSFWKQAPYNSVTTKKHYDNPKLNPKHEEMINTAKSLRSDLYWAKEEKGQGKELTWSETFYVFSRWVAVCFIYISLIVMGCATFGLCWPKRFRIAVTSLKYD